MSIPRTRRYPRRPIVKRYPGVDWGMHDAAVRAARIEDFGAPDAHAWTTNLTPMMNEAGTVRRGWRVATYHGPSGGPVGISASRVKFDFIARNVTILEAE